jgi:hypothetical protein
MRFGEQHRAGDPARLTFMVGKLHVFFVDQGESRLFNRPSAECRETIRADEK